MEKYSLAGKRLMELSAPARRAKHMPRPESSAQNVSAKTTGDVRDSGWLKGKILKEADRTVSVSRSLASWGHQGSVCAQGRSMKMLFLACQWAVLSVRTTLRALPGYCLHSGQFRSTRNSKIMRDTRRDQKHSSRKPRLLWFVVFVKFGTCHYTSWNTQKNWQYTWPAWASSGRKEPVIRSKVLMQPCMATCQNNCGRWRQKDIYQGRCSHTTKPYMSSHIRCMVSFSMLLIFMLITLFKN